MIKLSEINKTQAHKACDDIEKIIIEIQGVSRSFSAIDGGLELVQHFSKAFVELEKAKSLIISKIDSRGALL